MSENRDAYVKKMKAKLDEWNAEIAKLEAQARKQEADTQLKLEEQIESLKKKRQSTEDDLDKLRQAGGNAWEDLKTGVENAASSLGDAIRSATSRFK
jgi:septal ring factor EnvC (AmiA/AmiB activator)